MNFDTILFDLDDTIHDRNKSLSNFVELFKRKYSDALAYESKLIIKDIFFEIDLRGYRQEMKFLKSYNIEFYGSINPI